VKAEADILAFQCNFATTHEPLWLRRQEKHCKKHFQAIFPKSTKKSNAYI